MRVPGSGPSYSTLALPSYTRRRLFILRILVPAVDWAGMAYGPRLPLKLQREFPCCSARRGPGARLERGADSSRTPGRKQSKHLVGRTRQVGTRSEARRGPIDCDGRIG